ncbi:MAG: antirestriction protein ArdA [Candidatus Scatosoma sp.]
MEQIELVLENAGVSKRAMFPCTEAEYRAICKELFLKDNYAFVRETITPKAFGFKEDTFINLDELNYLAKRMDSFDGKETKCFLAAVETGKYRSTKDLINLTFNLNCYTLIGDVSDLKEVGYNRILSSKICIAKDELEKIDLEKIGRELLSSGKGTPTNYGLLFRNEGVEFEKIYSGKGFPPYYYTGGEVLGVEIEKNGEQDYIYFPCEKTEIERAVQRIGAGDIIECNKRIDFCGGDEEWEKYFNDLLQKNDIESVNAISSAINRLGENTEAISENLYKLSAVMEFAGVMTEDTEKVIRLAGCLDEFEYYREIGNDYNLGTKLIENEIGAAAEKIDDYIDYEKYAQDFLDENGGAYTKYGDVVYLREDQTLSEILGDNEIKMGGI